ncbi:MAG: PEP-CTERM sorting domain-containing protein [Phycisphaeraceae bacterium]
MNIRTIAAACLALTLSTPALAGENQAGNLTGTRVHTKVKRLCNNTGQDANDFHVAAYQKEKGVSVNGAAFRTSAFDNITVGLSGGSFHNDGKNHQANANMTGGLVTDGQCIELDIWLYLTKRNQTWLRYDWTKDGQVIGGQGDAGVNIDPPAPGGDGGDPGQQEGDGGSDGNHVHAITIYNDMNKAFLLDDFYALASTTTYDELNDIDWTNVPPIFTEPITVPALSTWSYDFETSGSFFNGHIYLNYLLIDDEIQIIFDHPVPTPATLSLMSLGLLTLTRRR